MRVEIDEHSGFCFGVVNAIRKAEQELERGMLYCIGDIVHLDEAGVHGVIFGKAIYEGRISLRDLSRLL